MGEPDDYDDEFYDDGLAWCPKCNGTGEVRCRCGGDQCYCDNHGDAPCPMCHGDTTVTEERAAAYEKRSAETEKAMREIMARYLP